MQVCFPMTEHEGQVAESPRRIRRQDARGVRGDAMHLWFVRHLRLSNLGRLSSAHLGWADLSPMGAADPKCIRLAHLCSRAVDFAKTGVPAGVR